MCDRSNKGEPGLNFLDLRSVRGDAPHRFNPANWYHNTLHPNVIGHEALGAGFTNWYEAAEPAQRARDRLHIDDDARSRLAGQLKSWATLTQDTKKQTQVEQKQSDTGPACNVFDETRKGCKAQGVDWALAQVSALFLREPGALLLILGGAGAWATAVAVLAGLRRRWAAQTTG